MSETEFLTPIEARRELAALAMVNAERIATVRARIAAAEETVRALKLERRDRYVLMEGFRRLRDDVGTGRFKITSSITLVEEARRRGGSV